MAAPPDVLLFGKRNKTGFLAAEIARRAKLRGFESWRRSKPRLYGSEKQYPQSTIHAVDTVWRAESKG
jgi:hypothetical protein